MSDDKETFHDIVKQLTTLHAGPVERDTGTVMLDQDGLLQQLREAVFGGMGGSGGAQFGSKPPIDTVARDLLDEITTQATEALASVSHLPTPYGHAEDYVSSWASQTSEHKMISITIKVLMESDPRFPKQALVVPETVETTGWLLVSSWRDRIEDYFNPASTREIKASCPVCSERWVHRRVEGSYVQASALNFVRDRKTQRTVEAKCSACARTWLPFQFDWLATAIGVTMGELIEYAEPKKQWGERTTLPEGRYSFIEGWWVDSVTGFRFQDEEISA